MIGEVLGSAAVVAVIAEEYDGKSVLVAADASALGNIAIWLPRLVELPTALLARSLLDAIQGPVADDAVLQFVLRNFQVLGDALLFSHYPEINSRSL